MDGANVIIAPQRRLAVSKMTEKADQENDRDRNPQQQ